MPLSATWREKAALPPLSPLSSTQTLLLHATSKNNLKQVTGELFFLMPFASGTRLDISRQWKHYKGHHTFSPRQSQNILFNCISAMLMSIRSLTGCFWSRPPMQHFSPGSYLERLHRREEKREGKYFWPPILLPGLKPTEPQNCKPSPSAAFQDHKV